MIQVDHLSKNYQQASGQIHALSDVSFAIQKGEWAAIAGESGSGKSTLLNIISGVLVPDAGTVHIDGTNLNEMKDEEKAQLRANKIAFITQDFNLLDFLSVMENVGISSIINRKPVDTDKVLQALKEVDLEERAQSFPGQLSGGQQQRVAAARALYMDADILLADEPTGNLDAENRDKLLDVFEKLHRQNKTILMVTHDPKAMERAGRIIHLTAGKVDADEK